MAKPRPTIADLPFKRMSRYDHDQWRLRRIHVADTYTLFEMLLLGICLLEDKIKSGRGISIRSVYRLANVLRMLDYVTGWPSGRLSRRYRRRAEKIIDGALFGDLVTKGNRVTVRKHYRNGNPIGLIHCGCDDCNPSMINGKLSHERGCRDAWRDYKRKCTVCRAEFYPPDQDERNCHRHR